MDRKQKWKTFWLALAVLIAVIALVPSLVPSEQLPVWFQRLGSKMKLNKKVPPELLNTIMSINDAGKLADTIVSHLNLNLEEKQSILEILVPVDRLRIDLWSLAAGAADPVPGIDPKAHTMWSRVGTDAAGRFGLPTLEAGRYALRAQPCNEDGTPQPLQPQRRVFSFAGHEAVPLTMQFAQGVVLAVEGDNAAVAAREFRAVVRGNDGAQQTVVWRSITARGAVVATNSLTLPQRATTLLALPIENYALELLAGSQPVIAIPVPGTNNLQRSFRATLPR